MSTKFKFPPINELAIGVYLNKPLLNLRAEHVGLFWHDIRHDFPTVTQVGPIVRDEPSVANPAAMAIAADEVYPLPRFWFHSGDGTMLLQMQRNAFLLNWRKGANNYPHFEAVKAEFDRRYGAFAEFARGTLGEQFEIEAAELTYINLAEAGGYWSGVNDIARVIPSFRPLDVGLPYGSLTTTSHTNAWTVAKDMNLHAKLQTAMLVADRRPALVFELSAKGRLGAATKAEADAWFERAHVLTGEAFRGMTSPEIQQRVWQPVGESG
ncbi:MAG: TIGR04255 family protein [Hyphomicrobiaceae bacterium]|nr:TIGR04255 family protein [Hyphomicrobiaceae bacterium]